MFKIGDQVVCVKQGPWKCGGPKRIRLPRYPEYRQIYTVSGMGALWILGPYLRFAEFDQFLWHGEPPKFARKFFRPVVKTDISVFTAMLVKETIDA